LYLEIIVRIVPIHKSGCQAAKQMEHI